MKNDKNAITVKKLIEMLNAIEDKERKVLVTSLDNFYDAHPVIGIANIEYLFTTEGPNVYLCMEKDC